MRKKGLLSMAPLYATDEMAETAMKDTDKNNRGSRVYARYFMAVREGDILKVAVFTGDSLRSGSRDPLYEFYTDREEKRHTTYNVTLKKWSKAKISFLCYTGTSLYCRKEWQTQETRDLVNKYFETGCNLNVFQAVLDFQMDIENGAPRKKYRSELEQIDATMKEVPDVPDGFRGWVEKNCFTETMFYEPKKRGPQTERMYCTHCETWMYQSGWPEGPAHKKETVCPHCGVKATYRSWNKQKYVTERVSVALLQRLNDRSGYILRKFEAIRERMHAKGWETCELYLHEDVRERLNRTFVETEHFEFGEYKYTGINRWCHNVRHNVRHGGYGYYSAPHIIGVVMYTKNLKEELGDRKFGHMDLEAFFGGDSRERVDPASILRILDRYPFIEYLQKSGLDVLAGEIMKGRIRDYLFKKDAVNILELLRLDGRNFGRLKHWNGGGRVLQALQLEAQSKSKLSDSNISYIISEKVDMEEIEKAMNRTGLNIQQILNYFERQQTRNGWTFSQARMFYRDYLDMAKGRGMDLKDDIVRRQPRMKEFHDIYLEEKNREEAIGRDREVDLKYIKIREDREKNKERFAFRYKGYVFLVPEKASDITREGRLQHHCVGASDAYLSKMDKRQTFIVFLRRKEDPDKPYYTVEAGWDGTVCQWYAAYDRKPDEEKIRLILERWSREVKKRDLKQQNLEKQPDCACAAVSA